VTGQTTQDQKRPRQARSATRPSHFYPADKDDDAEKPADQPGMAIRSAAAHTSAEKPCVRCGRAKPQCLLSFIRDQLRLPQIQKQPDFKEGYADAIALLTSEIACHELFRGYNLL